MKDKGRTFHPPRLTTTQRNALSASSGMFIWNTTTSRYEYYNGSSWAVLPLSAMTGGSIVKSADETTSGTITPQNDDELYFSVVSGSRYIVELILAVQNLYTDPYMQIQCVAPAAAVTLVNSMISVSGSGDAAIVDNANQTYAGLTNMATSRGFVLKSSSQGYSSSMRLCVAFTATSDGTFNFKWSPNTASGSGVTVKAGSTLLWFKQ